MKLEVVRVMHVEIGPQVPLDSFKAALLEEDEDCVGILTETGFDPEGKVIPYLIDTCKTTVTPLDEPLKAETTEVPVVDAEPLDQ